MKTVIRRYDANRVAILPTKGFPEDYAKWLKRYAERANWTDFKIVVTQDQWRQLGVVCRPKQWIEIIHYMQKKGANFSPELEEEFLKYSVDVLTEETGAVEKKPTLNKDEKETLKALVDKAHEQMDKVIEPDQDEDKDLWTKQEETKPKENKILLK